MYSLRLLVCLWVFDLSAWEHRGIGQSNWQQKRTLPGSHRRTGAIGFWYLFCDCCPRFDKFMWVLGSVIFTKTFFLFFFPTGRAPRLFAFLPQQPPTKHNFCCAIFATKGRQDVQAVFPPVTKAFSHAQESYSPLPGTPISGPRSPAADEPARVKEPRSGGSRRSPP